MGPCVRRDDAREWRPPPPSLSCTAAKNLHTRNCRAVSEVASHVFPDHAFRDRSPVQSQRRSAGVGGGCAAADRYPPARAYSRRYRPRPGGRRGVRPGRAHPADLDPVPSRRGQAGAAGTRKHPRRHVDQRDRSDRPRFQLFLASRQHRRGPEQHPPDARPWSRRAAAERAYPDIVACKDGRFERRRTARFFQGCPGKPGADRASDRGPPQEHDGPRDGDRGATRPARTDAAYAGRGRSQRRTIAPRRADALADQSAAPDQAHRARRSRQRPFVL